MPRFFTLVFLCVVSLSFFLILPRFTNSAVLASTVFTTCPTYTCKECPNNDLTSPLCKDITKTASAGSSFGVFCTPPTIGMTFCDTSNWLYYRNPTCKQVNYPLCTSGDPDPAQIFSPTCDWQHDICNAADRCYGATTAGTGSGSDATGRVVPGKCDEQLGCISGTSQYKQCCSAGGLIPTTSCVDGTCPSGQDCNKNCFTF